MTNGSGRHPKVFIAYAQDSTLPKATIGNALIRDDAIADIAAMLQILIGLDGMLPEQFAPGIGIEPTSLVRIGVHNDLTSNSASMPMSKISSAYAVTPE